MKITGTPLYDTDTPYTPAQMVPGQVIYRRVGVTPGHVRVWVPCHPRQTLALDRRYLPSGPHGATVMCHQCQGLFDLGLVIIGVDEWVASWRVCASALVTSAIGIGQPMSDGN